LTLLSAAIGTIAGCAPTDEPAAPTPDLVFEEAQPPDRGELGYAVEKGGAQPPTGSIAVLVIFAQFRGEGGDGDPVPSFADSLFLPDVPGSFTHFYNTMSFGQLAVRGEALPGRYSSRLQSSAYVTRTPGEYGRYGVFVKEVLQKVDEDVDFSRYDNDGPDGVPGSGDDDGEVDFLFVVLRSTPHGFILDKATGITGLNLDEHFLTDDTADDGSPVLINGERHKSTILGAATFTQTVGTMAHEFAHAFGLPDLYDLKRTGPADDGAGIGRWGLMGRGARGWRGNDGPAAFCAWSREWLGWIGESNERLVEVLGDTTDLEVAPMDQGGKVYRVPLYTEVSRVGVISDEYLLLEYRARGAQYYERNLPADGLLVWHVRPQVSKRDANDDEARKLVDLVCADGLYGDAGHSVGQRPDPFHGMDNLDFWAHDAAYKETHEGNLGDSTDMFDGVRYTRIDLDTNPSTAVGGRHLQANTGLRIDVESLGDRALVDISRPRWRGTLHGEAHWIGEVLVDSHMVVAPEAKLVVYPSTRVHFAQGCSLRVEGSLEIRMRRLNRRISGKWVGEQPGPVVMEASRPGGNWRGLSSGQGADLRIPKGSLELRDTLSTRDGFPVDGDVPTAIEEDARGARPPESDPSADGVDLFAEQATELGQNYPNPFQGQTTIPYTLAEAGDVRLTVYNALGQPVRRLVDEYQWDGEHEVTWLGRDDDGRGLAGGLYLYELRAPGHQPQSRKMLMLQGMVHLSEVDGRLREQGQDLSELLPRLDAPEGQAAFGFAAEPTMAPVAYMAGVTWANLRVGRLQERPIPGARTPMDQLGELVEDLGESAERGPEMRRLLDEVTTTWAAQVELDSLELHLPHELEPMVQGHDEMVAAYFHLGEWLQSLKFAALAARQLGVALSALVDTAGNAAAARHFSEHLGSLGADDALVARVGEISHIVARDPRGAIQSRRLTSQLDGIGELLLAR